MSVMQRVVKPTTRKGKRFLIKREPQIKEPAKKAIFFQGRRSSETIRGLMKDLHALKKPDGTMLNRKNDVTVFEDATSVEQFCKKHDAPLFVLGSHSKKRPDNLVVGRMFDNALLDMVEVSVNSYQALADFNLAKVSLGCKPMLVFNGPAWDSDVELKQLKSIFVDFFHREHVESIRLQGLEHAISFTAKDKRVLMRSYKVLMKKSGCRTPRIELDEIGPRVDFSVRRSKLPTEDLMRQALRQPKETKPSAGKRKNISRDGLGNVHGRVHVGVQPLQGLQTRKMKGLKKTAEERKAIRKRVTLIRRQQTALEATDSAKPGKETGEPVEKEKKVRPMKRIRVVT